MAVQNLTNRLFARAQAMDLVEALPRLSGLPSERVERIRVGDAFSASEYEDLCRALAVDPAVVYRGQETQPNRVPARFRAALVVDRPSGEDIRLLALAVEQGRILAHLMGALGRPVRLAAHRSVRAPQGVGETWREGYELGEEARATLCPRPGPVHDMPLLLRELGVHVARVTFSSSEVDAASVWESGGVPVILLNKASGRCEHPGAVRATLAHELCHLLHDAGERDLTTQVSWGAGGQGNFFATVEVRARAFAPAFLAPRAQVVEWFAARPKRIQRAPKRAAQALGEHWGLSFVGAAWHAKNCGVMAPDVADQLTSQPGVPWLDLGAFTAAPTWVPPGMFHPDLPEQATELWDGAAAELVLEALDEGHVTLGRARELLTWG